MGRMISNTNIYRIAPTPMFIPTPKPMNEWNVPSLNFHPLIDLPDFSKPMDKLPPASIEPYHGLEHKHTPVKSHPTKRTVSFVPEGSHYVALQGDVYHPHRHLMKDNRMYFAQKHMSNDHPIRIRDKKQRKPDVSQTDYELFKYYIAGLGVVGLLMLVRLTK